jgi:hypothetical protein
MVIRLLGLWLILSLPVHALEHIQATTDASRLYEQQSLLLTITADDQLDVGALDIRPLFRAFIVGEVHFATRSQGSQFTSQWQIPLLPLHAGAQQIPPLPLAGYMSQALPLQVLKGLPPKSQPRILEVSLDRAELLPHQVALYRVKLSQPSGIQIDSITPPSLNGARIRQLGDDTIDNEIIRGKRIRTLSRYYTITLDQPGDYLLQSPLVQGQDVNARQQNSPFLQQGDNLQVRVINAAREKMPMVSDELTIESHWQPAKGPYRVGEPILRVLTLKAVGNTLDQLPAIPLPEFPGVRSYDDGGSSRESIQHGKLVAERTVRQAFIPQQQQTLVLPHIEIPWWDPATQQIRALQVKPATLLIEPPLNPATVVPLAPLPVAEDGWPWLTLGFASAWFITLLVWWFTGRRLPPIPRIKCIDDKLSWRQLKRALQTEDPQQVHQALLVWGSQRWPQQQPTCLEHLPCYAALHAEMDGLLQACYADAPTSWSAKRLRRGLLNWRESQQQAAERLNPHGLT